MRKAGAIILNLLVPGAGLILLRREWLGLVLALLFDLCAQIGLWGWWLVPAMIPRWLTGSAWVAVGLVWLGAQYVLVLRLRRAFGPGVDREVERLCQAAAEAMEAGDYRQAEEVLLVALTLNDESPCVNLQWAALMTVLGRFRQARKGWTRVAYLSPDPADHRRAREALAAMP